MTSARIVLRTERVVLREWRDDDLAAFAAMSADPEVMRHFPSLLTRAESDAATARIRRSFVEHGFGYWALEVPDEIPFAGLVGLGVPTFDVPFAHADPCIEMGWRLARQAQGRGFATEAARAVLEYGFRELRLTEIVAYTSVINVRSRRVMERLGMRLDPDAEFDHPRVPEAHPVRRHVVYRRRSDE